MCFFLTLGKHVRRLLVVGVSRLGPRRGLPRQPPLPLGLAVPLPLLLRVLGSGPELTRFVAGAVERPARGRLRGGGGSPRGGAPLLGTPLAGTPLVVALPGLLARLELEAALPAPGLGGSLEGHDVVGGEGAAARVAGRVGRPVLLPRTLLLAVGPRLRLGPRPGASLPGELTGAVVRVGPPGLLAGVELEPALRAARARRVGQRRGGRPTPPLAVVDVAGGRRLGGGARPGPRGEGRGGDGPASSSSWEFGRP